MREHTYGLTTLISSRMVPYQLRESLRMNPNPRKRGGPNNGRVSFINSNPYDGPQDYLRD